jgi:rRNA processing protein Gar1
MELMDAASRTYAMRVAGFYFQASALQGVVCQWNATTERGKRCGYIENVFLPHKKPCLVIRKTSSRNKNFQVSEADGETLLLDLKFKDQN